ncbi:MAG: PIG-L family deacetylase [Candidatus Lokiarchaeota archaeon]|nr:PIG-L family deacetylase [Candidatus Lokiarchaeota archaeon]
MNKKCIMIDDEFNIFLIPRRIMVFAGHPDDEIISCGGTLLKYQSLGSEIIIVTGSYGIGGYSENSKYKEIENQRIEELKNISESLNWKYINLGYNDLEIEREKIANISKLIINNKPHIILAPHYKDLHRIHRNFSFIIRESIFHCSLGNAYGLENRQWIPYGFYYYETISCKLQDISKSSYIIVDISDYYKRKIEILSKFYKSQKSLIDNFSDWIMNTASLRGYDINNQFGEAFIPDTSYTPLKLVLI